MAGASPATTMRRLGKAMHSSHSSGILSGGQVTLAGAMSDHVCHERSRVSYLITGTVSDHVCHARLHYRCHSPCVEPWQGQALPLP